MAFTFDASSGFTYENDLGSTFDGPELLFIQPLGVGSVEGFGIAEFTLFIEAPPSIATAEAFGVAEVQTTVLVTDPVPIVSAEAFGTPEFTINITGTGIASEEAFGTLEAFVQWEAVVAAATAVWTPDSPLSPSWTPPASVSEVWIPAAAITESWPKSAPLTTTWT